LGKAGRHSEAKLVRELTKGLPSKWVKDNLGTEEAYVKPARSRATASKETSRGRTILAGLDPRPDLDRAALPGKRAAAAALPVAEK
jgi:hypothetical protein